MRTVLFLLLCYLLPAHSQERMYRYECGAAQSVISWRETKDDRYIYLHTVQDSVRNDYVLNHRFETIEWRLSHPGEKTGLTVKRENGKYRMEGTFRGRRVSETVKSNGDAWFQNIAYNAGLSLRNRSSVRYECFRPDNLKLYPMVAERQGTERFNDRDALRVKVRLTGFLSAFWSCTYLFDSSSFDFIFYKGVHGAPGTPETYITRIK